jgi:hypothetical protein
VVVPQSVAGGMMITPDPEPLPTPVPVLLLLLELVPASPLVSQPSIPQSSPA